MDFKVVTFFIMFLFSFTILGSKAQQAGPIGNAPSWMGSFQRGPESGGTLYGLLSPPMTHPSGPEVQPHSMPAHPSDPHSPTVPNPSDPHPTLPHPSGPEVPPHSVPPHPSDPHPTVPHPSDPHPISPHPSEPTSPQGSAPHHSTLPLPSDPVVPQTQPLPRPFGPGGVPPGMAPEIGPHDCEKAFCVHKPPEPVHGPLSHDILV